MSDSMDRLWWKFLIPEILGFTGLWLTYPLIYAALVSRDLVSLWIFDTTDPYSCKSMHPQMFDFRNYTYEIIHIKTECYHKDDKDHK